MEMKRLIATLTITLTIKDPARISKETLLITPVVFGAVVFEKSC